MRSTLRHSATVNGAVRRADARGAAVILVAVALPRNIRTQFYPTRTEAPTFSCEVFIGEALFGEPVDVAGREVGGDGLLDRLDVARAAGIELGLTALLVGYKYPICALLTPCQAGASAVRWRPPGAVQRGVPPRAAWRGVRAVSGTSPAPLSPASRHSVRTARLGRRNPPGRRPSRRRGRPPPFTGGGAPPGLSTTAASGPADSRWRAGSRRARAVSSRRSSTGSRARRPRPSVSPA